MSNALQCHLSKRKGTVSNNHADAQDAHECESVSCCDAYMQCAHRTETALPIVIATAAMTSGQSYGQSGKQNNSSSKKQMVGQSTCASGSWQEMIGASMTAADARNV